MPTSALCARVRRQTHPTLRRFSLLSNDYGQEQPCIAGFPLPKSDSPLSAYRAPLSREDTLRPTPQVKTELRVASFQHCLYKVYNYI